jgi:hypothetical protein
LRISSERPATPVASGKHSRTINRLCPFPCIHGSDALRKIVEALFVNATLLKETPADTFVVTYSAIEGAPYPTYAVRVKPKPGVKSDLPETLHSHLGD